ncbi:MAG: hypothetical protein KBT13_01490, partial [Bacteroidales bacterium]|nr:hypothetical protein [Candidatus Sodaliphilus limicaballi]
PARLRPPVPMQSAHPAGIYHLGANLTSPLAANIISQRGEISFTVWGNIFYHRGEISFIQVSLVYVIVANLLSVRTISE